MIIIGKPIEWVNILTPQYNYAYDKDKGKKKSKVKRDNIYMSPP